MRVEVRGGRKADRKGKGWEQAGQARLTAVGAAKRKSNATQSIPRRQGKHVGVSERSEERGHIYILERAFEKINSREGVWESISPRWEVGRVK